MYWGANTRSGPQAESFGASFQLGKEGAVVTASIDSRTFEVVLCSMPLVQNPVGRTTVVEVTRGLW